MAGAAFRGTEVVIGYIPGAIGRVAQLHGEYYARHWGFGAFFEGTVAREMAEFVGSYDERKDRLWLAVQDGVIEGSIAIQGQGSVAHLRWFIVSDRLRGTGVGSDLVARATAFCRDSGFPAVDLWTFSGLHAARHLYEKHGFQLAEQREGTRWGASVTEQRFVLRL